MYSTLVNLQNAIQTEIDLINNNEISVSELSHVDNEHLFQLYDALGNAIKDLT